MEIYKTYKYSPRLKLFIIVLALLNLLFLASKFLKKEAEMSSLIIFITAGFLLIVLVKKFFPNNLISKKIVLVSTLWLIISVVLGGIFAWQYFGTSEKETPGDETADWETYKNEEYGYEIKYPEGWNVAKNILSFEPNLVFCPDSLATDREPEVICKITQGGAGTPKPIYEKGMVYLFTSDSETNNPDSYNLGFDPIKGKYYYLLSDGAKSVASGMAPTFKFLK